MAVGDDQILVIPKDVAKALAVRSVAQGMVKREQHRPGRLESPSATLALVAEAIRLRRVADHVHPADALALSERGLHRLDQAASVLGTEHQSIQDHMEIRPVRSGEQGAGMKVYELIPASQSHEAAGEQRLDKDAVVPWARVSNREQDHRTRLGKAAQQMVRHGP